MASRRIAVLAALLVLSGAAPASAAEPVEPRAGVLLSGQIQFPRAQRMTIQTDAADGTKLTVGMGFDGRCKGGGLGEVWAGNVRTTSAVRARDGRISASLTGTVRNLGGVEGRTGVFKWTRGRPLRRARRRDRGRHRDRRGPDRRQDRLQVQDRRPRHRAPRDPQRSERLLPGARTVFYGMSQLIVTEFVTLDGVMEAPGGEPGHPHSGWVFDYMSEEQQRYKLQETLDAESLLLGRETYDGFSAAWPERDGEFADKMNAMPKYVVSSSLDRPDLGEHDGHRARGRAALKARSSGPILVAGSGTLVHALLEAGLVDELRLMIFPVLLGSGLRVFPESPAKHPLALVAHRGLPDRRGRAPLRTRGGIVFLGRALHEGMTQPAARILIIEDDAVVRTFLADNLIADGYELVGRRHDAGRAASAGAGTAGSGRGRPDVAGRVGAGADQACAGRGWDRFAGRSHAARDRALGERRRARSGARVREGRRRLRHASPSPTESCRLRIAAVLRRARLREVRGPMRVGTLEIDPRRGRRRCADAGSSWRRRSSRCCARWPARPRGCSPRRNCCATCGASGRSARRATLDSHACRLRQKLRTDGDEFIVNVWGVGYRLVDGPLTDAHAI